MALILLYTSLENSSFERGSTLFRKSGWLTKIHLLPLSQGSSKKAWVYLTPFLKHVDSKTKNGVITSLNCNKGTSIQSQWLRVTCGMETFSSPRHRKMQFYSFMWCLEKLVNFSHIITTKILTNHSETKIWQVEIRNSVTIEIPLPLGTPFTPKK